MSKIRGSVSSGTMRTQDLLPCFLEVLREVSPVVYDQLSVAAFSYIPAYAEEDDDSEWWDSEDAQWKMEEMFDALDEAAPDGFYFGAHPGDGADYGFWPIEDDL